MVSTSQYATDIYYVLKCKFTIQIYILKQCPQVEIMLTDDKVLLTHSSPKWDLLPVSTLYTNDATAMWVDVD